MQFDVYLFDFDGTLVDSRASLWPVFRAGYATIGREVSEEEAERWMHLSLSESMAEAGASEEQRPLILDAILKALDDPESIAMITAFDDTVEVLSALSKQGKRIAIVSNNSTDHIRLVLKQLGIDLPFDCIVGSDMCQNFKPHPEPILMALEMMGVTSKAGACYVGDSLQDHEVGINAGIEGVLLDREGQYPDFEGVKIPSLRSLLA